MTQFSRFPSRRNTWAIAYALVSVLFLGTLPRVQAEDPEPADQPPVAEKQGSALDDELLKQLDDAIGGGPKEKHGHGHDHKPAADSSGADNTKKSSPAKGSAAEPKRPAGPSTDDELLKQLDAKDDSGAPAKKEKAGDDLGPEADPLTRIGTKMRQAVTLIDREKLSERTTTLQDEIVHDIDELIKKQKKKMQQQQQQSSAQSQQQKSQKSGVKPQGKNAQQKRPQQGGTGDQPAAGRPEDSTDRLGQDQQKRPQLDLAAQEELLKRVWGNLPEKDREQMRQGASEEFLPEYETLIIKYFRRLAEEENSP